MRSRRAPTIRIAVLAMLLPACSEPTRYRVLSFLFDGVPQPGAERVADAPPDAAARDGAGERKHRGRIVYAHPPYRENRCRACHDPDSNLLIKTAAEGLCQTCHQDFPGRRAYLHGPVAVSDCLACHHHHASSHPRMLLDDAKVICFGCHRRQDLTEGMHHPATEDLLCLECHDPHGGSERFFLRPSER